MRKIIFILVGVFIFFLLEFLSFNLLGGWFKPDLLILFIIFIDLYLGIRYGLITAFFGGLIKDSFSSGPFGLNIFTYILCAFLVILLRRNLFHTSGYPLRMLLALSITSIYVILIYLASSIFGQINLREVVIYILFPEVLSTMICADFVFQSLKRCVLKLSV